jgi:eukaryotic-like serine/threonine-protein kinase
MAEKNFARFQILGEIGIGGMGLVYQADDPAAESSVAIKILPPEFIHDLGLRANFEREVRLISSLEHESIVPVLEYGAFQGQPYLVMPYMPGGSLAERLVHGPLSPLETAQILDRLANALDYTHQQGIVHRDLKPSNILFGEDGQAFLADFGIALQNQAIWSISGVVRGSPAYLSPEQALRNESIDRRSDVYSLGIIVYEMLTGVKPFQGDVSMVVVLKQIHDEPPLLRSYNPQIPVALEEVVLQALAKNVVERYQTAGEFSAAFHQALDSLEATTDAAVSGVGQSEAAATGSGSQPALAQPVYQKEVDPGQAAGEPEEANGPAKETPAGWNLYSILAVGFVLWIGLLFGVAAAAIVRQVQASTPPNLQLTIDQSGVTLTNISQAPLNISGLSFRRLSNSGEVVAEFQAAQWDRLPELSKGVLPAGACYQLLSSTSSSLAIATGTPQPRPADCQNLVGWLAVAQPEWEFWLPQGGEASFQIVQDGKITRTCPAQAGHCEFFLAQP